MELKEFLAQRGLATALIVDDAYDILPLASDLAADADAWSVFFQDLVAGPDRELVETQFPDFRTTDISDLQSSDTFVAALWGLRGRLSQPLWAGLFDRYERDTTADDTFLTDLDAALRALGLRTVHAGRTIPDEGKTAHLVFADLFLGSGQTDTDLETSVARLKLLNEGREQNPPLVVLMSRSTRLAEKKAYFRDRAGLLGAMFRVHTKQELRDESTLSRTLERLARHHDDALRVAAFIHSWNVGLDAARDRFLTIVRRLDLADYSQIQRLLLDFEGQPLGNYLLDVCDRVLQHEIEGNHITAIAAARLNEIDTERYSAPYVAGSPDLQELVYRCICQHPERVAASQGPGAAPVSFGDILLNAHAGIQSGASTEAFVVMTPACDLAREGCEDALTLPGTVDELVPRSWTYGANAVTTPVVLLSEDRRVWVKWHLKRVRTMPMTELAKSLQAADGFRVVARLRESHALELQQKLLGNMGRVGVLANMPATFPVQVDFGFMRADGVFEVHPLQGLQREGGTLFVGRDDESRPGIRLVLGETACDEILAAAQAVDVASVHDKARPALAALKASGSLASLLERGLDAPPMVSSWKPLMIKTILDGGEPKDIKVGVIARNPTKDPTGGDLKNAGIVVVIRHLPQSVDVVVQAALVDEVPVPGAARSIEPDEAAGAAGE